MDTERREGVTKRTDVVVTSGGSIDSYLRLYKLEEGLLL
jgi:hypothetical protein